MKKWAYLALAAGAGGLILVGQRSVAFAQATAPGLNLVISSESPFVGEPEAARIVLQFHNSTSQALWLYRRARGKRAAEDEAPAADEVARTRGGATVQVKLEPADPQAARAAVDPAKAAVLEYVQMPKPRLVRLPAGGDYREVSILHLAPAMAQGQKPLWGSYRLTVTYGAEYSNGIGFRRDLGVDLWQGEVTGNTISVELRPPLPDSVGVASGTALGKDLQPRVGVRVSLSNEKGEVMEQQVTGEDGKFSFDHLPLALYWVTGRQEDSAEDTVTFRHEELTGNTPQVNTQLVFYPEETDDPKKFVHKPVLVRVFDPGHQPLSGIGIDAIYSNGDVLDDVKATTLDDGTAVMEVLPGRSSVALHQRGCADQPERIEVAQGDGAEYFRFTFECTKK